MEERRERRDEEEASGSVCFLARCLSRKESGRSEFDVEGRTYRKESSGKTTEKVKLSLKVWSLE